MKTKESFRKYISALPLFLSGEEYQKKLEELKADSYLVQKIQEHNAKLCSRPDFQEEIKNACSQDTDELVKELKEEYCRSTKV